MSNRLFTNIQRKMHRHLLLEKNKLRKIRIKSVFLRIQTRIKWYSRTWNLNTNSKKCNVLILLYSDFQSFFLSSCHWFEYFRFDIEWKSNNFFLKRKKYKINFISHFLNNRKAYFCIWAFESVKILDERFFSILFINGIIHWGWCRLRSKKWIKFAYLINSHFLFILIFLFFIYEKFQK